MKTTTIAIIAMIIASPAMAQTVYSVTGGPGNSYSVQGSDGSVYNYSVAPNGSYSVQKQGESGSYSADAPNAQGSYSIQSSGSPDWGLPGIIPPGQ